MPAMAPFAIAAAIATLALAGCAAGGDGTLGTSAPGNPVPHLPMSGRWMLAAPNAPPCGVELRETQSGQGQMIPDGGCPGSLYMSRRWTLADGALIITTEDNETLAQLRASGERFEGKAADGMPLTLTRKPAR